MASAEAPIRVLQIHKFLFDRGGLERYFFFLVDHLRGRGHRVVTLGMADPRNRPPGDSSYLVSPVRFPDSPAAEFGASARGLARALYSKEAKRVTKAAIAEFRPDVAHVHEVHHHLSPSVLVALREAGIPVVLSAHEYKLICPTVHLHDGHGICEACKGHRYWQPLVRRCSKGSLLRSAAAALDSSVHHALGLYDRRHVQVIAAGSTFTLDKLREFGIEDSRLQLLPYMLDPAEWGPPAAEPGSYLAFVGRLIGFKGADTLIDALSLAGDPPTVIAGDGPEREGLERKAAQLGLRRLRFAGYLPADQLRTVLGGAIAIVVPSQVLETFGFAVYESMAIGRPVIASRLGPLPELVSDGHNGLLFEPGNAEDLADCLRRVITDPVWAHGMGRAARRFVEMRTDPDQHYARLMEIYAQAGAQLGLGSRRAVSAGSPA